MATFRSKPKVVDAEQWFPGKEVRGVFMHRPPDTVIFGRGGGEQRYPQAPYPAVVTIHGRLTRVDPGDWIIDEGDGVHFYPCKPVKFEEAYEPAPDREPGGEGR